MYFYFLFIFAGIVLIDRKRKAIWVNSFAINLYYIIGIGAVMNKVQWILIFTGILLLGIWLQT